MTGALGMSEAELQQRARAGDEIAIATLIHTALRDNLSFPDSSSPDITVKAHGREDCLHILLEADPIPPKASAIRVVRHTLAQLRLTHVNTARLYGRQQGETKPAWSTEFELVTLLFKAPDPEEPTLPRPKVERLVPQPLRSRTGAKPIFQFGQFSYTTADLHNLLARLDLFKAGFVLLLALYGFFGAGNYTVETYLEGSDRIMHFLHGVNLIFHEAGHTLFAWAGRLMHIFGGSLMQILVPAVIAGYFYFHRQRYASAIALCWTAQNFWDVSIYIKDAQERSLPLLGGEGVLHDWHFLLLDLGLLRHDQAIGNLFYFIGVLLYVIAIGAGFYFSQAEEN